MPSLGKMLVKGDIVDGNDVWIGQNLKLLLSAHIGYGAIIGVNSVVGSDIQSYKIAVSNPCRVIKNALMMKQLKLLKLKWQDYPIVIIEENIDKLFDNDIDYLIEGFSKIEFTSKI